MTPRALIFDVDGTLSETEELHRLAFNAAFAEAGLGWVWDRDIYARLLKVTGGKERIGAWLTERGERWDRGAIADLHGAKTAHYAALVAGGGLTLRPGIAALIANARAGGLALGIATTTSRRNIEELCLATFRRPAAEVFDGIAAGDEVARKKPAPDVYLLALERLGLPAVDCVAFEDSFNGVASARASGLRVVACPSRYSQDDDLSASTRVVASFEAVSELGLLCDTLREAA